MSNQCLNNITVTSSEEATIIEITDDIPSDAIVTLRVVKEVRFTYTTSSLPDTDWLASLRNKYPSCEIKNEWISKSGKSGSWIGTKDNISVLQWDDPTYAK